MSQSFEISSFNNVTTLTLNNPNKHNALDASFWEKFPGMIRMLQNDKTRVLVLKANGKSFCSGLDISMFSNPKLFAVEKPLERERFMQLVTLLQDALNTLRNSRFPVIAAIQGPCIGAGLDLVSACDMRYATENAYFRLAEINLGLMADLGTLQLLPDSLPSPVVAEMAYTGCDLKPARAKEQGFLNEVFSDTEKMYEQVQKVAEEIAGKAPLAIHQTKLALKYRQEGHGITDSLNYAGLLQACLIDTDAIRASFNKDASYHDLEEIPDSIE